MLFHEFRHIETHQRFLGAEQKFRKPARNFGFADARRAKENKRTDRTGWRFQAGAAAADGASKRSNRFILADHTLVKFRFDTQQLLLLVFLDGGDGNACPTGNHFFNILTADDAGGGVIQLVTIAQSAQRFLFLALFLGIEARFLEFMRGDRAFHAVGDELHTLLYFADFFRNRRLTQFYARARFVDQVDGFVRQEAIGNVAVRKIDRVAQRFFGIADGMKLFVAFAHATEHENGFVFVRSRHLHGLEAALKRTVLLNRLAVFAGSCCADALNFAARKCGLQDVSRIERAFCRSGSDQCVQLVNKDDGVLALHQFLHDGLQAFFELSAILCPRNDQRQVKRKNAFVSEERRHVTVGNALCESFDDGGLTDAGFADQYWIILGSTAENLDHAIDFAFAAHQRVKRAFRRGLC